MFRAFIWNDERSKRGFTPVLTKEEMDALLKSLGNEAANENSVFEAANDNTDLE